MNTSAEYIEQLHRAFSAADSTRSLFEQTIKSPTEQRENILQAIARLRQEAGLAYALAALYRQQVSSGFVLADPLSAEHKKEKEFFDADTGITFRLQWNPDRELRKNHSLLIERKVIATDVDETRLVNIDKTGKACYLCKDNIDVQNPGEVLLDVDLAGEKFYAGANFAYITNNHFTVMNAAHRPQAYRSRILAAMNDFVDETAGCFRVIFNGLAGASIKSHEHLQATTEKFPIEDIKVTDKQVVYETDGARLCGPDYHIALWLVEGTDRELVESIADKVITLWYKLNEDSHTENIIVAKSGSLYRMFVILRDKDKLAANSAGKKGAMAAFETGGNIVLSYQPAPGIDDIDEKQTFDRASLETVKQLLAQICPDVESASQLSLQVVDSFH